MAILDLLPAHSAILCLLSALMLIIVGFNWIIEIIILAIWVDLLSPMIWTKIRHQGLFGSERGRFLNVFTIYGHGSHLGLWTDHFSNLSFPSPKKVPFEI